MRYFLNKAELGVWGEERASQFLLKQGYCIVARNFRSTHGEIDIVAIHDGFLCFVEVKTRSSVDFGWPCEAVDKRKQLRLKGAAQNYLLSHPEYAKLSPRNDVIEVLQLSTGKYIRHISGAF
ncbi:MAG: YraN family protein [Clostridia bacterium]|nr:YraN family protein [Clostridia bacterium]